MGQLLARSVTKVRGPPAPGQQPSTHSLNVATSAGAGFADVLIVAALAPSGKPGARGRLSRKLALELGFATTGALLNHGAQTT